MESRLEKNSIGGLRFPKKDGKEWSFGATFGFVDPKKLPEEYLVGEPLEIKNQGNSDLCVGFSFASARELQEEVKLSPEYIFMAAKRLEGDYTTWGLDPKIAGKAIREGILEKEQSPYEILRDGHDRVANPANWAATYDELAKIHTTRNYFWVEATGKIDLFDAIRLALYQFQKEKRAIVVGGKWRSSWLSAVKGIIPIFRLENDYTPHAFVALGWKKIDGKIYLITQLSSGVKVGDKGLFYFERSTVNKEFVFAMMFADMPETETKESIVHKSQWYRAGFWKKILLLIKKFILL